MTQTFVPGEMQELVSNIEFSLNFEDKKGSVKVKIGDTVLYDGVQARFIKNTGEEITGKSTSLRSAIGRDWLAIKNNSKSPAAPTVTNTPVIDVPQPKNKDGIAYKQPDYDALKGGSFDAYVEGDPVYAKEASTVIKEEDQVIKKTNFIDASEEKPTGSKFEVTQDQRDVRTVPSVGTSVTSSTSGSQPAAKRGRMPVVQSDDGHASQSMTRKMASVTAPAKAKKNSFTVDGSTPTLSDDATLAEVQRTTRTDVVDFNESQDGKVIKKMGEIKAPAEPVEVEGIVFKKTEFTKILGSTPVADLSGVSTQDEVNAIEKEIEKKTSEPKGYVDMLPENWSSLHWTKKEKFILRLTDKKFVEFIMAVEGTKAIQNACKKRLTEIG